MKNGNWKLRIAGLMAMTASLGACGEMKLNLGAGNSQLDGAVAERFDDLSDALDSAVNVEELMGLTGGMDALSPDLSGGLGGSGFEQAGTGGFAPSSASEPCPAPRSGDPLPADAICYKADPRMTLVLYFPDPAKPATARVIDMVSDFTDEHGGEHTGSAEDLDVAADAPVTDRDLFHHKIRIVHTVTRQADGGSDTRTDTVEVNFNGLPDPVAANNPGLAELMADAPDVFYSLSSVATLADGTKVEDYAVPSSSATVHSREDFSGTHTHRVTFPAGRRIVSEERVTVIDRTAGTATMTETRVLANFDEPAMRTVDAIDDGTTITLTLNESHPNGHSATATATITKSTKSGSFTRTVNFPTTLPEPPEGDDVSAPVDATDMEKRPRRVKVEENGTMSPTGGTIHRVITFSDGSTLTEDVTTAISGDTTTVDYTRGNGASGHATIVRGAEGRTLTATAQNAKGDRIELEGVERPDGTIELEIWVDRAGIAGDLDLVRDGDQDGVGQLNRDPDGRITGTAWFLDADGNVHEVNVDLAPGEPSRIKDAGRVARDKVRHDLNETTMPRMP